MYPSAALMAEGMLQFNVLSVVRDVLQQHGKRLNDIDLASRKVQEASLRRYEAAGWIRKMVGVVAGKDFPAEPSEEEFRIGLRSGIMLCNVLNKVQPGAVPKVVEAPSDIVVIPDGTALSAYQYFENIRNFLDSIGELGIPTFEASDLEQGGKPSRIVSSVLALKSYYEWKQGGGNGVWKFSGNSKPPCEGRQFIRKNSDLFMNSILRNSSVGEKLLDGLSSDMGECFDEMGTSHSLRLLVRELLSDKKEEDIPEIVENMLGKVMEEFECRLASQKDHVIHCTNEPLTLHADSETETSNIIKDERWTDTDVNTGKLEVHDSSPLNLVKQQQINIQKLKSTLQFTREDLKTLQMKYQEEVNNLGKHLQSLSHAASEYQRVLDENRKLYNQVQDLKGNIRVYCRVRPFLSGQPHGLSSVEDTNDRTITLLSPSKYGKDVRKTFTANKVFGQSASQEEVFADTQPLIRSVLDGYNVCIFAYGQTGSGKTYTMSGPEELTKESLGVNYRALSDLFFISEQRKDTISYEVSVQMMEIYNEQVRDLLATDGINKKLEIRNNSQNGINVPNANLVPVTSTSDVINLMNLGHKNRAVGSTAMNVRSSRSHSCLTVHVQGKDLTSGTILRGCMHLVDLAGSERADKSEAVGDRLKEAQHINRSLSALGDVISALAQKNSHVPYRNSKLTQLLQDSLGGQAKTLMFVHISPEPSALGETISTLKFSERVSTVELGAAKANKESADVKELKEQIASLKAALARKEGESGRLNQSSRPSTPERKGHSDTSLTSRRLSIDSQDLINSPPWPPISSPGSIEEEKAVSHDWVDKAMVNRAESLSGQRRYSLDNGLSRSQYETAITDESDDLEAATSESSEMDYQWLLNMPRSNSLPNVTGPKVRRPSPKQTKSPEIRSLIPPPTKRGANGIHSPLHKLARQPVSVDGRRKTVNGK
ncbi:kinesin-like protein KIN-14I [Primulina huaijiensis]|uniref:kinesin-like protein KIN-14I n=1 Tax=Primulina huaijiensis TaxID=1492673 RepID=UPI003CC70615